MPVGDVKDEKIILQKRPIARIVAYIITLAIVLAIVTIQYFDSLGDMLFAERKVHLVEITDKVAEVIDSVGVSSWNQVSACRHMITHSGDINRAQELLELLKSTADFIDTENTIALAIDSDGNYYGSDGSTGYWMSSEMLFDSDTRRR